MCVCRGVCAGIALLASISKSNHRFTSPDSQVETNSQQREIKESKANDAFRRTSVRQVVRNKLEGS